MGEHRHRGIPEGPETTSKEPPQATEDPERNLMSEEQLERSILERKASDELRAIATAMSLEPVARTRKADLVNQILRAAGVEIEDAPGVHAGASEPAHSPAVNGAAGRTGSEAAASPGSTPAKGLQSQAHPFNTQNT